MKRLFFLTLCTCLCLAAQNLRAQTPVSPVKYPNTATGDVSDDYFGTRVADPYRWLEADTAAAVKAWVAEQNKVTNDYLSQIPYRDALRERYAELYNFPKYSAPFQVGNYYFFSKNDGLQNQSVIYRQKGLDGQPEVFIDPNKMSKDGTTAFYIAGISGDDRYMAVSVQEAGSDWQPISVYDVATMKKLPDEIKWSKFGGASWWKDGFFYSRYPEPAKGTELSGNNMNHSVYYHKIGTPQIQDKLIFADPANPAYYNTAQVTEDEKYLILYQSPGTDGYSVQYKELGKDGPFVTLFSGYQNKSSVVFNIGSRFLVQTNIDAPNFRLVEVDLNKPDKANWKEILPETENLLEGCSTGGGKLFASYLEKATNRIYQYDYDGKNKKALQLPGLGAAGLPGGREKHKTLFYSYSSFLYPPTIFKYEVTTEKSSPFQKPQLKFNPEDYVERQVTYKSKDGTPVTMFVVHKKDLKMDGNNPCLQYGYGGFGVNMSPYFSTSRILLLENGGVWAMPNLRGGGEYGEDWHKDGMLTKKQNVFDDFIAASEYLIAEKYTSPSKLAISGGSNGGLLVGACMTQRPDLYAAAFPAVGVMDMLRFQKFTVGKGWVVEFGSSEQSPEMFKYLLGYSPLHNIKPGVHYPATLVTTADHDDRVVPAHSYKFIAALQKAQGGNDATIIRIETNAGHGSGKPTSKIIDEMADMYSFFFYNTNTVVKKVERP
ncbi:MAG TPA: prolyl oligopeptidase family serine peptidase [Saprospiraceae bacterium]|nr:prolyl oligopeptidase family serine peptidase [Saprospiraceae bacterium]